MYQKRFLLVALVSLSLACRAQTIVLNPHDVHIHYMGRVVLRDEEAELSWSCSSLTINFQGTGVKATLKDEHGENYFNVVVDDKVVSVVHPDSVEKVYTLVSGLPNTNHTLCLYKRTEWAMGKTWFYQFELDKNSQILPVTPTKKRKIEFYGNSITCGMADEDTTGKDRGSGPYENGYLSYAAIIARHFDAEFYSISKSGIGITVSWFPLIMPEMYNRLDPSDDQSIWDFKNYTPDLVVINLFQNDSWIVKIPDNEQFKARFGVKAPTDEQLIKAYRNFLKTIRDTYPKAQIICTLGSMDATKQGSPWPGYIEKAATSLGDKKIFTHFIPYKNTPGHPSVKEQQAMADDLTAFIDQNIKW